jgi:exonuclease III
MLACLTVSNTAQAGDAQVFTSWNIDGATLTNPIDGTTESKEDDVMTILQETNTEVMCLNESGTPERLFSDSNFLWHVERRAEMGHPAGVFIYRVFNGTENWGWLVWRDDTRSARGDVETYRPDTKQSDMIFIKESVADAKWENISSTQAPMIETKKIAKGKRRALLVQNNDTVYGCYHATPAASKLRDRTVEVIDYGNKVAEYAAQLGWSDRWIAMGDMNITPSNFRDNEVTAGPIWDRLKGPLGNLRPSNFIRADEDTYEHKINPVTGRVAGPLTQALDWFLSGDELSIVQGVGVKAVPIRFRKLRDNQPEEIVFKAASDHAPITVEFLRPVRQF